MYFYLLITSVTDLPTNHWTYFGDKITFSTIYKIHSFVPIVYYIIQYYCDGCL